MFLPVLCTFSHTGTPLVVNPTRQTTGAPRSRAKTRSWRAPSHTGSPLVVNPTRQVAGTPSIAAEGPIVADSIDTLRPLCGTFLHTGILLVVNPTRQTTGPPSIAAERPIAAESFSHRFAPGRESDTPGRRHSLNSGQKPYCRGHFSAPGIADISTHQLLGLLRAGCRPLYNT